MIGDKHLPSDAIGSRIRSGLAWKAGSQLTLQLSRMVVALVLARLLAPHDWGVAAMVLAFSGFVVVFTDSALGTALIQRRELRPGDRSTVFWLSVGVGALLAIAGIAFAGPLARFYGEPAVRPLFAALSIGFLVSALGATQMALLVRDMQFNRLELRQMGATVVGAAGGISIAVAGFGPWAIVGQQLAEVTTSTVLLWVLSPWRPSATFSSASLRRLGGFAGNVFGQNLLFQTGRNLGNVLIGRLLGPASVGAYVLATNVILMPFARIAGPLQQVFFPAFSRMTDDRERLADVWIRATRLVALISIPPLVGLAVVAPDFVHVVLGDRWHRATPVIQILVVVGIVQALQTLNAEVLLALDKAGTLLRFTMLWFVGTIGATIAGVHWGIVGVAVCYAAVNVLVEPVNAYITTRALGIPLRRFLGAFTGVVQATALMAGGLLASRAVLVRADVPTGARLVLLIGVGTIVFVGSCLWRAPEVTVEIKAAIRHRRQSRIARAEVIEPGASPIG
jgi:O-antigen/teichoic acid export membrane protein